MKVLLSTTGKELSSPIDPRFGRAMWFAVVETDTRQLEVVENAAARAALQGAGIQAAELAARLGVTAVITGHCGPKAFAALQGAGIRVVTGAQGTVTQALEDFLAGRLQTATGANVQGHWA